MNDTISSFERLTLTISPDERRSLLSRLKEQSKDIEILAFDRGSESLPFDAGEAFKGLSPFMKILYTVIAFFSGVKSEEAFKEDARKKLALKIQTQNPLMFDAKRSVVRLQFKNEMKSLQNASEFFGKIFEHSIDIDRAGFFAFLITFELEALGTKIASDTDPDRHAARFPGKSESDIRINILDTLEDIVSLISPEERKLMYEHSRKLACLKKLSVFPFAKIIEAFNIDADNDECASLSSITKDLSELANILFSLKSPPSITLLEALFIYALHLEDVSESEIIESDVASKLALAHEALNILKSFMNKVPLIDLIRYGISNLIYVPDELSGGEDWLALCKQYWKSNIEKSFLNRNKEIARKRYRAQVPVLLKTKDIPIFLNIHAEEKEDSPGVAFDYLFSYLSGFYSGVFTQEYIRPLKILLLDGEFYKKDNRSEYTEAFTTIQKIDETLKAFDQRLGPNGDLTMHFRNAKAEKVLSIRKTKVHAARSRVEGDAKAVIMLILNALYTITLVANGVLKGDSSGKYDSIANIGYIDGKNNAYFKKSLIEAIEGIDKALVFLRDSMDSEIKPSLNKS